MGEPSAIPDRSGGDLSRERHHPRAHAINTTGCQERLRSLAAGAPRVSCSRSGEGRFPSSSKSPSGGFRGDHLAPLRLLLDPPVCSTFARRRYGHSPEGPRHAEAGPFVFPASVGLGLCRVAGPRSGQTRLTRSPLLATPLLPRCPRGGTPKPRAGKF